MSGLLKMSLISSSDVLACHLSRSILFLVFEESSSITDSYVVAAMRMLDAPRVFAFVEGSDSRQMVLQIPCCCFNQKRVTEVPLPTPPKFVNSDSYFLSPFQKFTGLDISCILYMGAAQVCRTQDRNPWRRARK